MFACVCVCPRARACLRLTGVVVVDCDYQPHFFRLRLPTAFGAHAGEFWMPYIYPSVNDAGPDIEKNIVLVCVYVCVCVCVCVRACRTNLSPVLPARLSAKRGTRSCFRTHLKTRGCACQHAPTRSWYSSRYPIPTRDQIRYRYPIVFPASLSPQSRCVCVSSCS